MDDLVSLEQEFTLDWRQDGPDAWTAVLTDRRTRRQIAVTSGPELFSTLGELLQVAPARHDPNTDSIGVRRLLPAFGYRSSAALPQSTAAHRLSWEPALSLSVAGFTLLNDALHAVTNFVGTITDATGSPTLASFEGILLPVKVRKSTARVLRLEFELLRVELLGTRSAPALVTLEISDQSGPGLLKGDVLGSIARAHEDPTASPQKMVRLLNQLLTSVA
jgi:hypothetical protein